MHLNIRLNQLKNVVVNPIVLGEREGCVVMNQIKEGEFRAGTSTLTDNDSVASIGKENFTRCNVTMKSVDDYIDEAHVPKLDFVKVDIEGYEIKFLAGASKLLATHRPVILMEHNQRRLQYLEVDEGRFKSIFHDAEYDCFELFELDGVSYFIPYQFDRKMRGINLACLPR
jgi:FkbM family methyltransferase